MYSAAFPVQLEMREMSKKNKQTVKDFFNEFDPAIEKLATDRVLSGQQLYDHKTHHLHRHIRDEVQARAILLRARLLADSLNVKLVLRSREKRLLARAFDKRTAFSATEIAEWQNDSARIIAGEHTFGYFIEMMQQAKQTEILSTDKLERLRKIILVGLALAGVTGLWRLSDDPNFIEKALGLENDAIEEAFGLPDHRIEKMVAPSFLRPNLSEPRPNSIRNASEGV